MGKEISQSVLKALAQYNAMAKSGKGASGDTKNKDKRKNLAVELHTFNQWDDESKRFATELKDNKDIIPTGLKELDDATGVGGFPKGKMIELFGTESGGKSFVSYHAIASCQKDGGVAALLDVENSYIKEWGASCGIDNDNLIYYTGSMSGEGYLELAYNLCAAGNIDLLVIDSTAALVPQAELDSTADSATMALQARMLSPNVRKIMAAAGNTSKGCKKTTVIWINQIREKPGVMWGNPETTPGGKALKFYCHMRIDVRKMAIEKVKMGDDEIPLKQISRGTFVKNKCATAFKKFEFEISFESFLTNSFVLLAQLACSQKLFRKFKGEYKYNQLDDTKIITGKTDFVELAYWIYEEKLVDEIIARCIDSLTENNEEIPDFLSTIDENTQLPKINSAIDSEGGAITEDNQEEDDSKDK